MPLALSRGRLLRFGNGSECDHGIGGQGKSEHSMDGDHHAQAIALSGPPASSWSSRLGGLPSVASR